MTANPPPVFCHLKAFSDGKAQKGMILHVRRDSNKLCLQAHPSPIADAESRYGLTLQEDTEASTPTPFEATFVCCGSEVRTRAWYTKIQVFFRPLNAWVPILEFENPPRLPALHVFPLEGDTAETCAQRIRELQVLRAQVLLPVAPPVQPTPPHFAQRDPLYYHPDAAPLLQPQDDPDLLFFTDVMPAAAPPPAPPPRAPSPKPPGFVPRFVADLVKREAISKGDACAITMATVEECERPTMTSCFHIFEGAALEEWLRTKTICPSCRQTVTDTMEL
jgi:hypothetical protein